MRLADEAVSLIDEALILFDEALFLFATVKTLLFVTLIHA
ncbi:hypothetical protein Barb6XT_00048 [Bacteroidales bacterium Barb6XT]|nr:hypothetical protein Barb6XT_00048 [Bacteroidales bacterium Barb6XT]OAV72077.1 hypothetical protein Barb4_00187 [Bacteroidales bacterium Barb4]